MIDPHVHCRDGLQAYKTTIGEVFVLAREAGIEKIFDMPNTDPPILTGEDVERRLGLVPKQFQPDYFLYVGATADPDQLAEAVRANDHFREVVGIKLFAGKSVGDLSVPSIEGQGIVYRTLTKLHYRGVLAVHCEKESLFKNLWDPNNPISHSYARPPESEIESVRDQITLAKDTGFEGILHICHVSTPESVDLIDEGRNYLRITCGATPHHLMWNMNMFSSTMYKMNPPLRSSDSVLQLKEKLKQGKIDWIETDHAPHSLQEKIKPPYLSGYPSMTLYKEFVGHYLHCIGLDEGQIRRLTEGRILEIFGEKMN